MIGYDMKPDSFVYCWVNKTKNMYYLGYHKGTLDDGYICSSRSNVFWKDWETDEWERIILFEGTQAECVEKEWELLKNIDESYYNLSSNGKIIFTEEVRAKMRKPKRDTSKMGRYERNGSKNSFYGKKHSEESKRKMSEAAKKRKPNGFIKGDKHSDETKRKMSNAKKGKPWTEARRKAHASKSKKL